MHGIDDSPKIAAIFDLDGTLFTGHFWQGIVNYLLTHRLKVAQTALFLATHYPLWLGYKLKVFSEEAFKQRWGEDLPILLKGYSTEKITQIYRWIDLYYAAPKLRVDMVELIKRHNEQGHITFILSGSFQEFLEIINERLGAQHVIGTRLVVNDRCSGKIEKPLCFGKSKVVLLNKFIDKLSLKVDLKASFGYSDSLTDVPLLEMVGNPVASYADKGLVNLARERGWKILPV